MLPLLWQLLMNHAKRTHRYIHYRRRRSNERGTQRLPTHGRAIPSIMTPNGTMIRNFLENNHHCVFDGLFISLRTIDERK